MMKIVFEGIDCAGKTTIAKSVAGQINAVHFPTPNGIFRKMRDCLNSFPNIQDHYDFYVASVQNASFELSHLHDSYQVICIDRYWMSTMAYHKALGAKVSLDDFAHICKADWTFLLDVSNDVQEKRFSRRGMSIRDKQSINLQDRIRENYQLLCRQNPRVTTILTDNITIADISKMVIEKIQQLQS